MKRFLLTGVRRRFPHLPDNLPPSSSPSPRRAVIFPLIRRPRQPHEGGERVLAPRGRLLLGGRVVGFSNRRVRRQRGEQECSHFVLLPMERSKEEADNAKGAEARKLLSMPTSTTPTTPPAAAAATFLQSQSSARARVNTISGGRRRLKRSLDRHKGDLTRPKPPTECVPPGWPC